MVFNLAQRLLLASTLAFTVVLPGLALTDMHPLRANRATTLAAQTSAPMSVEQLNLSDQQKQKLRTIRKTRNQAISKVLNATQRNKLVQALKSGTKLGAALQTLNLSADQKKKIGLIAQKSEREIIATLTPKQRQQLEAYRKQHSATVQSPIE